MRGRWLTILVLLGCGGLLAWRHGPTFPTPDPDDANAAVWQALDKTVDLSTDVFSREPLKASDAFTELSRYLNLPIAIDSDADFDFQPALNATIRWPEENLTARQLIDWILAESTGRGALPVVKHGQLTLIGPSERGAVKYFVGQVHLIPADLLATTGESSQSLADLIQEIVEPESWPDLGGKAQIRALPGALAVVHRIAWREGVEYADRRFPNWLASIPIAIDATGHLGGRHAE